MSTSTKLFLLGFILCLAAFVSIEVASVPEPSTTGFTLSDTPAPWSIWDYLFVVLLTCSVGLFIAGIKLRQR